MELAFIRKWRSSVFVKFSAAFLLVGMIPLVALSIFSLQAFTGHVRDYTVGNLKQMTLYMSYNVNNFFQDYDEISRLMYTGRYEGYSHSIALNQTVNVNELEQINEVPIDAFLKMVLYSDKQIRSAYFIRYSDGKMYYQTRQSKPLLADKLPIGEWLSVLEEKPNHLAVYPAHPENYYSQSNHEVITFGRNLIDISGNLSSTYKVVGTLLIDVDAEVLDTFVRDLNLGESDELHVQDGDGVSYYSKGGSHAEGDSRDSASASAGSYLELSEQVPYLNGRVLLRVSEDGLLRQLGSTRLAVYVAIGICLVAMVAMGIWFSRRLAAPIRNVLQHMNKVEMGNLDTQIKTYGNDEMGRLAFGFNRMLDRLKIFIDEAYVAEIKQKQTELSALKSQIRPHYLYNTLEVIRMNAVYNDDGEVADMILSLSNQLKYVIDYGEDWVSIQDELDHLRDYFYIISVRFENRLKLHLSISDEVEATSWQMPKLSLQPIVENAVQHGLRPQSGKGAVLVSMERIEGRLAVTVYDDGVGMAEGQLEKLRRQLGEGIAPSKNVGMKNVHDRIRSVCGDGFGLEISSMASVGTSVRLWLPIRQTEEQTGETKRPLSKSENQ